LVLGVEELADIAEGARFNGTVNYFVSKVRK
jgi:hypothetical protein